MDILWTPFSMPFRHLGDTFLRTPSRHQTDTLNIPSRHISAYLRMFLDTLPMVVIQFRPRGGGVGGWVGGWSPVGKYSHFVVQLARLQDFKQGWNSQVGPSVAIKDKCFQTKNKSVNVFFDTLPGSERVQWTELRLLLKVTSNAQTSLLKIYFIPLLTNHF